jgi:hypothetical protein
MRPNTQGGSRPANPTATATIPGRLAIAAFGLHLVLLFFPPLPPDIKGSLWSYLLGYGAVILGVFALAPAVRSIPGRWGRLRPGRRVVVGAACAAGVVGAGLAVRMASPELFVRWAAVEGVFEPLTLLAHLVAGMTLLAVARDLVGRDRRFVQFFGGVFFLLALEEVDYLGIVGGMVGRIDGVYVGTPHDLINLAVEGSLTLPIALLVAGIAGSVAAGLLWTGHLQPLRALRTVFSPIGLWLWAGLALFGVAALEDAGVWFVFGQPRIEELLELAGALLWLCFGLELAARFERDTGREREPAIPAMAGAVDDGF